MGKNKIVLVSFLVFCISMNGFGQYNIIKSNSQTYVRGVNGTKFTDTSTVLISYDLDDKSAEFTYVYNSPRVYQDVKSLSLKLAFVDKKSLAPIIYSETIDKDISAILLDKDVIVVKFRNGNQNIYNDLKPLNTKNKSH